MNSANLRAAMFNKNAKPYAGKVLKSLNINTGDVIADIGSGGGFFTFEFAKITSPKGKVFAIDTNSKLLAYMESRKAKQKLENIQTVIADEKSSKLPENSCDLIFMRNVFHHIEEPVTYLHNLGKALVPNGRIAIIEWKPGASHHGHGTTGTQIIDIMTKAGYRHIQSYDFLDKQSFNIFEK